MSTASPLEIAWTTLAGVGLLATLALLGLASVDYQAVRAAGIDGYRRRYAGKLLRETIAHVTTFVGFVAMGAISLATPPPIRAANQHASFAVGAILVVVNASKVLHTVWTLYDEYWVRLRLWSEDRAWHNP